jgi:DNA-binding SARP family transcriptional activator
MVTSAQSTVRRASKTARQEILPVNEPIFIGLLGSFRLFKAGHPLTLRNADKTRGLLCNLALQEHFAAPREQLLHNLWPEAQDGSANQSLNSLVYSVHKLLGDALGGAAPVIYADGYYRLNVEAGIAVDVTRFETLVHTGLRLMRSGQHDAAIHAYAQAVQLYRGDLCRVSDIQSLVLCESLRAQYLSALAEVADHYYAAQDYSACLSYAQRLLASDPCREDAHRLMMRCYVRQGQRAQALHQYRICEDILRTEFDVAPEAATMALYHQIRLQPDSV